MSITFDGIKKLRSIGGGCIRAYWDDAVSDVGIDGYNVYIRCDDSDVFSPEYRWATVRNDITSVTMRTEADRNNFLRIPHCYYVGVNAIETGGTSDGNLYILAMSVYGDGSQTVEIPDRKIAKIV